MIKSVKVLLCTLLLVGLFAILIMCESDAQKVTKSKELIQQHAQTALDQKDAVATNKKELLDAWGRPIIYTFGPDIVVGMSSGFDGKIGTDDDIIVIMKSKVLTKTDSNHFLNHTH
ncbi:hypothetical protein [Gimesia sp.]|uniref:hypothetical protein n=1 Tax=Gimesia sp. TaxID=2024833 RepID=UPI003A916794